MPGSDKTQVLDASKNVNFQCEKISSESIYGLRRNCGAKARECFSQSILTSLGKIIAGVVHSYMGKPQDFFKDSWLRNVSIHPVVILFQEQKA